MINCQLAKELINQDLDDELNKDLNNQLEEHLAECESCYLYRQDLLKLHNSLLKLPEINLSESIVDSLVENNKLDHARTKTTRRFRKLNVWHGLIAAVIIAVVYIPVTGLINNDKDYSFESNEVPYLTMEDEQIEIYGDSSTDAAVVRSSSEDNASALQVQSTQESSEKVQVPVANDQEQDTNIQEQDINVQEQDMYALTADTSINYRVEVVNNQLVIYDSYNNQIFMSAKWDDKFTVKWEIDKNDFIIYQLFDDNGQVVAKYRINLVEKKEEIIN